MLHTLLSKVMDLPFPQSMHEAKKKIEGTWVFLNGNLVEVAEINLDDILYRDSDGLHSLTKAAVKDLDLWLPDSGVYKHKDGAVILIKNPNRQWKKSFSTDFYSVELKHFNKDNWNTYKVLPEICNVQPASRNIWLNKQTGSIFYLKYKIGHMENGKAVLRSTIYQQEVEELLLRGEL